MSGVHAHGDVMSIGKAHTSANCEHAARKASTSVAEAALVSSCASSGPLSLHKLIMTFSHLAFRFNLNLKGI